jgi:hypothetical protein
LGEEEDKELVELLTPASVVSFDHLVHYGGSYYCYLLCRALASDIWSKGYDHGGWKEKGDLIRQFLANGSVDQSLHAIYKMLTPEIPIPSVDEIPLDAMMAELRKNEKIRKYKYQEILEYQPSAAA